MRLKHEQSSADQYYDRTVYIPCMCCVRACVCVCVCVRACVRACVHVRTFVRVWSAKLSLINSLSLFCDNINGFLTVIRISNATRCNCNLTVT